MFVAGDIGGTKSNLAFFELHTGGAKPVHELSLPSNRYASLAELLLHFLSSTDLKARRAYLSIAGPVKNGHCVASNLPWEVSQIDLQKRIGFVQVELVNDLVANAYGISLLFDDDFVVINKGDDTAVGTAAVISAGTGLGEAGLYWDGLRHHPFASEGGHSSFSPENDLQVELLQYLRKILAKDGNLQNVHVSTERVLSGMGLCNIYDFLRQRNEWEEPEWLSQELETTTDKAAAISRAAFEKNVTLCIEALNLFVSIYGAEAGNLALKIMATGGVFIGGGIAPKILKKLKEPIFMNSFLNKGRLRTVLEAMPVKIIMNDKTALLGAVKAGREQFSRLESSIR